jgi:membrane-bound metal-dependent hydrolase YbcI (DUF457 family)
MRRNPFAVWAAWSDRRPFTAEVLTLGPLALASVAVLNWFFASPERRLGSAALLLLVVSYVLLGAAFSAGVRWLARRWRSGDA